MSTTKAGSEWVSEAGNGTASVGDQHPKRMIAAKEFRNQCLMITLK
jgi:hypothetical protein